MYSLKKEAFHPNSYTPSQQHCAEWVHEPLLTSRAALPASSEVPTAAQQSFSYLSLLFPPCSSKGTFQSLPSLSLGLQLHLLVTSRSADAASAAVLRWRLLGPRFLFFPILKTSAQILCLLVLSLQRKGHSSLLFPEADQTIICTLYPHKHK